MSEHTSPRGNGSDGAPHAAPVDFSSRTLNDLVKRLGGHINCNEGAVYFQFGSVFCCVSPDPDAEHGLNLRTPEGVDRQAVLDHVIAVLKRASTPDPQPDREQKPEPKSEPPGTSAYPRIEPDAAAMLAFLEWLVAPARGAKHGNALVEIAWDNEGDGNPTHGQLFPITAAGLAEAVKVAIRVNFECGSNVYVGMMLKHSGARWNKRTKVRDCYVCTTIPCDIDKNAEATNAILAQVGTPQLTVTTGTIPALRQQAWLRLSEPCTDRERVGLAFDRLVKHVGGDTDSRGAYRLMRLAGSASYPCLKKQQRGYAPELTTLSLDETAPAMDIQTLLDLPPRKERQPPPGREDKGREDKSKDAPPQSGIIVKDLSFADLSAALMAIPNSDESADRDLWLKLGAAVFRQTGGSEEGRKLFDKWTSQHPTYDESKDEKLWQDFAKKRHQGRPATARSILKLARANGWRPQKEKDRAQRPTPDATPGVAADGRPRIRSPYKDAPHREIVELLDKLLLTDEPEPPMRNLLGDMVGVQLKEPAGIHLLTAETVNIESDDDEVSRLSPPPHLSLYAHDKYSLELLIEKHACFFKLKKKGDDWVEIDVALHENFRNAYLAYKASKLPRVNSIATMPIVLPNSGRVLAKNGLDRERKILFRIAPEVMEILPQGRITDSEIVEAMQFLTEEWLVDVQTDYAGKCVLIALALAILQGPLFSERPAFFITAAKAGGGKTTAINMVILAVTGKRAPATAWSPIDEERRKAIFAAFRQGMQALVFDNIRRGTSISCPHIEKAITAETIDDRVLGTSDNEEVPSTTVPIFTGNNIQPKGDLASRSLMARILVDRPDPANRNFKHEDVLEWTHNHRGKILNALYTILLGNPRLAQTTKERAPVKTRFKKWQGSIGTAVEYAAELCSQADPLRACPVDFAKLVALSEEVDEDAAALGDVLEILDRMPGEIGGSFSAKQVVTWMNKGDEDAAILRAFLGIKTETATVTTKLIGKRIKSHLDTPINVGDEVWMLKSEKDTHTKNLCYQIHKKK
jgi:hypothetical protein